MKKTAEFFDSKLEDAALVEMSLGGRREAFGAIIDRYQSLVCSMAYSACGNLGRSEELAQETFVVAWQRLKTLQERSKLKSWICGIARNLINNAARTRDRSVEGRSVPIERAGPLGADEPSPDEQTVSQEEETLLWQTLETIPERYREPLVLYYRESQSIAGVAAALEISEDNAKQRLSRGRRMLKAQMAELVESTLSRSRPGPAFTIAVMAALPSLAPQAAAATVAATAAKGSAAAKSALGVSALGAILGPVIGLLGAWFGARSSIRSARTPRERQFIVKQVWILSACSIAFSLTVGLAIYFMGYRFENDPVLLAAALGGLILIWMGVICFVALWGRRTHRRIQKEEGLWNDAIAQAACGGFQYTSRARLLGLPLVDVQWEGGQASDRRGVAKGWIAIGDVAFGILFSCGAVAVGGIAFGGVAVGALSLAGLAIGGLCFGGGAIGILSLGGFAAGWVGAHGGLAVAFEYAAGGVAAAAHVNDAAARSFFENNFFFRPAQALVKHSYLFLLFCLLPVWTHFRQRKSVGAASTNLPKR